MPTATGPAEPSWSLHGHAPGEEERGLVAEADDGHVGSLREAAQPADTWGEGPGLEIEPRVEAEAGPVFLVRHGDSYFPRTCCRDAQCGTAVAVPVPSAIAGAMTADAIAMRAALFFFTLLTSS